MTAETISMVSAFWKSESKQFLFFRSEEEILPRERIHILLMDHYTTDSTNEKSKVH